MTKTLATRYWATTLEERGLLVPKNPEDKTVRILDQVMEDVMEIAANYEARPLLQGQDEQFEYNPNWHV